MVLWLKGFHVLTVLQVKATGIATSPPFRHNLVQATTNGSASTQVGVECVPALQVVCSGCSAVQGVSGSHQTQHVGDSIFSWPVLPFKPASNCSCCCGRWFHDPAVVCVAQLAVCLQSEECCLCHATEGLVLCAAPVCCPGQGLYASHATWSVPRPLPPAMVVKAEVYTTSGKCVAILTPNKALL